MSSMLHGATSSKIRTEYYRLCFNKKKVVVVGGREDYETRDSEAPPFFLSVDGMMLS